jgi:hypothetical protein
MNKKMVAAEAQERREIIIANHKNQFNHSSGNFFTAKLPKR